MIMKLCLYLCREAVCDFLPNWFLAQHSRRQDQLPLPPCNNGATNQRTAWYLHHNVVLITNMAAVRRLSVTHQENNIVNARFRKLNSDIRTHQVSAEARLGLFWF